MPDFAHAQISSTSEDLTEYKTFLRKLTVGQSVTLPIERNETSRQVMRLLNAAARESGLRLTRLPSTQGSVRFKVATPEKRPVRLSAEARKARTEKARATRAAKRSGA